MATKKKSDADIYREQAATSVGQANLDRAAIVARNKREAEIAKRFNIGDGPGQPFSGSKYYEPTAPTAKKCGGSIKAYKSGGTVAKYIPYDKNSKSAPAKTREQQDVDARKDREADKGRFNKQVENAKAEAGMASANKQYAKSSNPVVDKIMAAKPTPASTPAPVKKSSPAPKTQMDKMKEAYKSYGSSSDTAENQAVQKRLSGGPASYGFKSGGSVKSSASSRGDGCAQRGKTRGRFV